MKQRKYFLISFLIPSLLVGCIPPPDKTPPPVKTLPGQDFGSGGSGGGSGGGGGLINNNVKFTPGSLWTTTAGQLLDTLPPSVGDKLIFFETATTGCTGTVTTAGTPSDLRPSTLSLSCGTAPLTAAETIAITSSHTFQIGSTTYTSNTIGDRLTAGSDTYRGVLADSNWLKGGIFRTGGTHTSDPTVAGESIARFANNATEFCQGTVVTNGVPATYGAATCGTPPMSTAYPVHVTSRFTFVVNGVEYTVHSAAPLTMGGGGILYNYHP